MRKTRVYVDTSVFGGTQDNEFRVASKKFFEMVKRGEFHVLFSDAVLVELINAPPAIKEILGGLSSDLLELVTIDEEVDELTDQYIKAGVLGPASYYDAQHVATATVARADLILSWNFRHIVNFNRIKGFNSVNIRLGYHAMTIMSPREVICDED